MVGCFHGKNPAGSTIRVEQPNMVQRMFALCSERVDLVRQIFRHSIPVSWGPHVVSPFRDPRQSVKSRDFTRDNPQRKKTKCHVHHCAKFEENHTSPQHLPVKPDVFKEAWYLTYGIRRRKVLPYRNTTFLGKTRPKPLLVLAFALDAIAYHGYFGFSHVEVKWIMLS